LKKQDAFVALTGEGVQWAGTHRSTVITWAVALIVAVLALTGGISLYSTAPQPRRRTSAPPCRPTRPRW
jgi:hypothetical protein